MQWQSCARLATQHAHNATTTTTTPSTQAEGLVSKKGFIQKKAHGGKGRFQKRFFAVQCQLLSGDAGTTLPPVAP